MTGDSGFVELVKSAPQTIIMKTRLPDFDPVVVEAIRLYSFDRDKYFEIFDIPRVEIEQYAKTVADYVQQTRFQGKKVDESLLAPNCCSSCT